MSNKPSKLNKPAARVEFITAKENFLLRLRDDGLFETHSDTVARFWAIDGSVTRLWAKDGTTLRRAKPRRARADAFRAAGATDEQYLAVLAADGAKRLWLTSALLRVRRLCGIFSA